MSRYVSGSSRAKQGEAFERYVIKLINDIQSEVEAVGTRELYDNFFTKKTTDDEIKKHTAFFSEIDNRYGDIHLMRDKRVVAHISCKSSSGTTVTITQEHIDNFDDLETMRPKYFAIAHVDLKGQPHGDVLFVPSYSVATLHEEHALRGSSNSKFIGLQHFLLAEGVIRDPGALITAILD